MGVFDYPLETLQTCQGVNPRPDDFDSYWDRGLAEIEALDADAALTPAEYRHPTMDCYDLYYTGTHNARIYAKYMRPAKLTEKIPAVLQFHGYSGSSGNWADLSAVASAGFAVVAMDVRGQGGKSIDTGGVRGNTLNGHIVRGLDDPDPDRLFYRDVFLDAASLARIVASFPDVDGDRLGAMGGSQGGALALACAALAPIRAVSARCPFLCDYQRVWEMDMAKDAYRELEEYFRRFDPRHEREQEIFTKLGYIDVQHLSSRIQGSVRLFIGLMDTICPPSTQFAAYNKIKAPKSLVLYSDFGHEEYPGSMDETISWFARKLIE